MYDIWQQLLKIFDELQIPHYLIMLNNRVIQGAQRVLAYSLIIHSKWNRHNQTRIHSFMK